ncbi:LPD38 domain-containing protein [Photobacterium lipolyticum]|uniref:Large polyvalent protein associated domain-containing protein n=1 Tax=Photobacterium lipolyticum TaxID=266810 RepID=A0A2T3MZT8_9GAMM|nr:LPD38 domain-containing protein [Photobacterium lipolyticum]PSW05462.1 hypothetical protein C9I89_09440 [Photobacterium lipolyticum]
MFANASIQGSANFARTMYGLNGDGKLKWQNLNNGQKIALGAIIGSFAFAAMNRAGEDDDGVNWYDKVPNYVKERNFVIMKSFLGGEQDGSYWKIPMPYGYNLFSVIGTSMEAVVSGSKTTASGAGDIVTAALGSFSPIGMQESDTASGFILKNALPTILKPFAEVGLNENFMGGQVYRENLPFGTPRPDSELGRRGTAEQYKKFAQWLNEKTGGSAYRSGGIDINPDVMKYVVNYLGGGALRFGIDKAPEIGSALMGNDVEDRNIAFWSRIEINSTTIIKVSLACYLC